MESFETLCGITVIILVTYYYFTWTFDFWKSRGIHGPRPIPFFGNVMDLMLSRRSVSDYMCKLYDEFKEERMVGLFSRRKPVLFLKDLDLIQDVLITNFSVFPQRAEFNLPQETKMLSQHMICLDAKRWRPLRIKISPVFTSHKLKEMFPRILECSEHLEQNIKKLADRNVSVNFYELLKKYTMDVTSKCIFGIETYASTDENCKFLKIGKKIFTPSWYDIIRLGIKEAMPRIYSIISYILPQSEITKFILQITAESMEYREKNNIIKHDFVDILRDLKNNAEKLEFDVTEALIASQAYLFLISGFETSALTISHALYELALYPKVQDMLRKELHEFAKNGDNLTYDNVKQMTYLDKVFKETLRKYPLGTHITRRSMCNYTFNGTNVTIPKGQRIWIPVFAIHRDPQFFPEPDIFDPERFNKDVVETRHSMCYLPFGNGPRNCIGAQFVAYKTKVAIIKILRNHKVGICEKTQIPYQSCPKSFILTSKCGIHLSISKIDTV